jgi:hypothetical protein
MLNSTILDVAIGLVFCFASVALFVSAIHEGIASLLKLRHTTLLAGIKQLLNDPHGVDIALKLYNHALVNPLAVPATAGNPLAALTMPPRSALPAYIPSKDFASALMDTLLGGPADMAAVNNAIGAVTDPQLKQLLMGFATRADQKVENFRQYIADWFDNAMNRLSGAYKRQSQLMTFVIGLVAAVAFNINSFYVLDQLWHKPSLAAGLSSQASADLIKSMAAHVAEVAAAASGPAPAASAPLPIKEWNSALGALPVGWDKGPQMPEKTDPKVAWLWLVLVGGWFVTATASVFGAPFWFDVLQKLAQVRGTGTKPPADRDKDKSGVTSAATH